MLFHCVVCMSLVVGERERVLALPINPPCVYIRQRSGPLQLYVLFFPSAGACSRVSLASASSPPPPPASPPPGFAPSFSAASNAASRASSLLSRLDKLASIAVAACSPLFVFKHVPRSLVPVRIPLERCFFSFRLCIHKKKGGMLFWRSFCWCYLLPSCLHVVDKLTCGRIISLEEDPPPLSLSPPSTR